MQGPVILSILICSTPERNGMFKELYSYVTYQIDRVKEDHPMLGDAEIIYDDSKRFLDGGLSIGKKRELVLNHSKGKYICYLDSDESVSPDYVETLLRLCKQDADVCTFRAMIKLSTYWGLVDMRLSYKFNDQSTPDHTIRRQPWHTCPVKSEYAKLYAFNDKNNAEDFEWMEKVLTHCTTEAHTDRIIFCYQHGDHSEADKIQL